VSIGETVDLQCLTEDGVEVTDWLFREEIIGVERSRNYELKDNGTLTINGFDPSYAGLYRCVVRNDAGQCVSKAAILSYFDSELVNYLGECEGEWLSMTPPASKLSCCL